MPEIFSRWLLSTPLVPGGQWDRGNPGLFWLQIGWGGSVAIACLGFSVLLLAHLHKRHDPSQFKSLRLLAGLSFICGLAYLANLWTIWHPTPWFPGFFQGVTTVISGMAVISIFPLATAAIAPPGIQTLKRTNQILARQNLERQRAESQMQQLKQDLEHQLVEQTLALQSANQQLEQEKGQYHSLLEAVSHGIWICDVGGAGVSISECWQALTGHSLESIAGEEWKEILHPDDRDRVHAIWLQANATKTQYEVEYRLHTVNQTYRHVYARGVPVWDRSSQGWKWVGICIDITEKKQTAERLRQSEERFRIIFDHAAIGIALVDGESGQYLRVNQWLCQLLEYTEAELLNRTWQELTHPEDLDQDLAYNQQLLSGERSSFSLEKRFVTKTGNLRWTQTTVSVVRDASGAIEYKIGVVEDIEQRRQAKVALRENEEQFRWILRNMPVMLNAFSPDGTILIWNQECERVTGYSSDEIVGNPRAMELLYPDRQYLQEMLNEWQQRGQSYRNWEWTLTSKDGTVKTIAWSNLSEHFPVPGWAGWGIGVDVSDRKRAEAERQQAEAEIRLLNKTLENQNRNLEALVKQRTDDLLSFINALPDSICVVERDTMRIPFCNEGFARMSGANHPAEIQGKTLFECLLPIDAAYFAEQNQQVFDSGETLHVEEMFEWPHGILYLDTFKIPLKQPNGEVYALIRSSRDITELVMARRSLTEQARQLESTNHELESFSYSVSHDLRSPLRHINGFVAALGQQLLVMGVLDDPKINHYLRVIEDSGKKMGLLIDGLLTLSRIGRRPLERQSVNLETLVQQAIRLAKTNLETDSHINLLIRPMPTVQGDAALLQQVFTNLIDNAVKFSRDRNPAEIEIGTLPDDIFFIRDNGVGFQMAYADQLFGAFQRLHSSTEFEGTGIGLAIVQRIIHRHGGRIWVESQPDQGTCFYFRLTPGAEEVPQ